MLRFRHGASAHAAADAKHADVRLRAYGSCGFVESSQASHELFGGVFRAKVDDQLAFLGGTHGKLFEQGGFPAAARSREEQSTAIASLIYHCEAEAFQDVGAAEENIGFASEDG